MAVLLYLLEVERGLAGPLASCNKGISSNHGSPTSWPDWFSKAPPLHTTTLWLGFQHTNFGGTLAIQSGLPGCHPFLSKCFPFDLLWCKSHAAKGYLVCSLHTGGIYFPWKSFPALDLESFLHLPHSVFCKWLSAIWSLFHTVSCHSDNHLATQFPEKRRMLPTEGSLISLLILTTLAFSCYHKT